jgi:Sec-independent protein translocase protein TatA
MLFGLGFAEIGILVLVVLFLFGGSKMKDVVKSVGKGIMEVKKVKSDIENDVQESLKDIIK